MTKHETLSLDDAALLRLCRVETCRGTGPGGQKRNKTSSAARVVHLESGLAAIDDTTRSQHQNLARALNKLRLLLAVHLPPDAEPDAPPAPAIPLEPVPRPEGPRFALWAGQLFDAFQRHGWQPAPVAADLGCSTSHLTRLLARHPDLWQQLAQARQRLSLPPLHA